jgi:hypothetical protein
MESIFPKDFFPTYLSRYFSKQIGVCKQSELACHVWAKNGLKYDRQLFIPSERAAVYETTADTPPPKRNFRSKNEIT